MTTIDAPQDRAGYDPGAGEKELYLGYLAWARDTLRWKCSGLSADQLAQQHAPSTLSLGGLLKHLAVVEAGWVNLTFAGGVERPSWFARWDPDGDEDWTFTTAADDPPSDLFAWLDETQAITERIVADADLDALAANPSGDDGPAPLRWILLHLVQEYARHLGHADLLREAVDGSTGT